MHNFIVKNLISLLMGFFGGYIFAYYNFPLPWMLGSFTISLFLSIPIGYFDIDNRLRRVALPILGVLIIIFIILDNASLSLNSGFIISID